MTAAVLLALAVSCWPTAPLHAAGELPAFYLDEAYYQKLSKLAEDRIKLLHPDKVTIQDAAWQDIIKDLRPEDIRLLAGKYPIPQNLVPQGNTPAKPNEPAPGPGVSPTAPGLPPAQTPTGQQPPASGNPGGPFPNPSGVSGSPAAAPGPQDSSGASPAPKSPQAANAPPRRFTEMSKGINRLKTSPELFGPDTSRLEAAQDLGGPGAGEAAQHGLPRRAAAARIPGQASAPATAPAPDSPRPAAAAPALAGGPLPAEPQPQAGPSRYSMGASMRSVPPLAPPGAVDSRPVSPRPATPALSADSDQLTPEELQDLQAINDLLRDAVESGALDSDRLDAEVQRLVSNSAFRSGAAAAVLDRLQELVSGLGGFDAARPQGDILAVAKACGLSRLTPEQSGRLIRAWKSAAPPAREKAGPESFWAKLWRWLLGLWRGLRLRLARVF